MWPGRTGTRPVPSRTSFAMQVDGFPGQFPWIKAQAPVAGRGAGAVAAVGGVRNPVSGTSANWTYAGSGGRKYVHTTESAAGVAGFLSVVARQLTWGGKEPSSMSSAGKSVVLVHGGFVDRGAGLGKASYDILQGATGLWRFAVRSEPRRCRWAGRQTRCPPGQILDEQTEPVLLVGQLLRAAPVYPARRARTRRFNALVYVNRFQSPDGGRSR